MLVSVLEKSLGSAVQLLELDMEFLLPLRVKDLDLKRLKKDY